MSLGVGKGDEVITSPFTWISTAEVITLLGATPVFCDINDTFHINPKSIKITSKTKVIMPVSLFGHIYDVDAIQDIVEKADHKIYIVEDAAQSFGSVGNKKSCSVGDIGCTSFFPSKPLGCFGDGGMCFTDNDELAKKT
jgi:UDP-2-acetamido-2-deoxy-ribo-hexuluronate aminotransferase